MGEGHKWSVAGEFLAPPGNGSSGLGGGAMSAGSCLREPLEIESGEPEGAFGNSDVGKSEAKLRKWTGVWLGRRTPGAQAELSRCAPGVGSPAAAGVAEGI